MWPGPRGGKPAWVSVCCLEKGEVETERVEDLGLWLLNSKEVRAGRFPAREPKQEACADSQEGEAEQPNLQMRVQNRALMGRKWVCRRHWEGIVQEGGLLPRVHHPGFCPDASPTTSDPASLLAQRSRDPTRQESQDTGLCQDIRWKLLGSEYTGTGEPQAPILALLAP